MSKQDLVAQITAIENELTSRGISFEETNKSLGEAKLKAALADLEQLLPDDENDGDEDNEVTDTCSIKIKKGVNIQIRIDGKPVVLAGGKTHQICSVRAKEIVAEGNGEIC